MSGVFWSKAGSPIFEVEGRQPHRQRLEPAFIGHAVSGQWSLPLGAQFSGILQVECCNSIAGLMV
jgi:hypothetical protein